MALLKLVKVTAFAILSTTVYADFHVSVGGSDSADGSAEAPFATLERAQQAVRQVNQDMSEDLCVHVEPGVYYLDQPLNFTSLDSGMNGYRVIWEGSESGSVNISGGIHLTTWEVHDEELGIYTAATPIGIESRHLYADQTHAQRARQSLDRSWLQPNQEGYQVVNDAANFLLSLDGIDHGEIRGVNSFTDRSIPIVSIGSDSTIKMAQPAFDNNVVGYDTMTQPAFDNGFFIENVLSLLNEENEFYLNSTTGMIYYKPPAGRSIEDMYLVLPKLEQLLVLSGSYDEPVHHLVFQNFNYMHTTWNRPSTNVGYADQQTGAYIGLNTSYAADFEASRPFWWQVPGSVQASAAHDIVFTNGSMVAIMGGLGIGNDANAHTSGVGLGAQNIEIRGMYFSQTGTNSITIGGVQADAHHPSDARMINENILVTENILFDVAKTYVSGAGLLATYTNATTISRNDVSKVPYSGICWGYGWGANDAGGSDEYQKRGLYDYQPRYTTPTTLANGLIARNLVHDFGRLLDDEGAIYTLAASPNTNITGNYIFQEDFAFGGAGIYHDEGSRDYVSSDCVFDVAGNVEYGGAGQWLQRNERDGYTTGNLTAFNIAVGETQNLQTGTNQWGDNVFNVTRYTTVDSLSAEFQQIVYNAGIPVSQRANRPVSYRPLPPPF